jgi:hypothetical protein
MRGRAQSLDSLLLTPTDWRRMGDIRVGDLVIGGEGQPTPVIAVHPRGEMDVFRVTFNDGTSTECTADHLWTIGAADPRTPPDTVTLETLVDRGLRVDPHVVDGWWKDTGQVQDILEANRLILDDLEERVDGELVDSRVEGRVVIESEARLERAVVRGPAIVGRGSRITDAYIGPYTAVGDGVRIDRAELEHSIVLSGSTLEELEYRIEASLIGKNVRVARGPAFPRAYRFVVGDNADIQLL